MITLHPLDEQTVTKVSSWRLTARSSLRTVELLSESDQLDFLQYPPARSRFFSLYVGSSLIGMGGFTDISLENRSAEISLILDPHFQGKGYGSQAVSALLAEAFLNMNLHHIYGECYHCSPALDFWKNTVVDHKGEFTYLPMRKFWDGKYYNSTYFIIYASQFTKGQPSDA